MSDANHLFLESLHDYSAGLEMEFSDYLENVATARYRVLFTAHVAYRNFDEMYRLQLGERLRSSNPTATGWTLTVPNSPWVREFADEPAFGWFNPDAVHYLIFTENDVVEVLSNEAPTVERLD